MGAESMIFIATAQIVKFDCHFYHEPLSMINSSHWLSRIIRGQKSLLDHFRTFAAYNRWANLRLYEAAGSLGEDDYHRDCAVAFHSMHGTLNHILVGDVIWLSRFQKSPPPPYQLDSVLAETLDELTELRSKTDAEIIRFVDGLDMDRINATFTYSPVTLPEPVTLQLGPALAHLFNHQTHHRGQAHAILTRLTGKAPPLDLIYFHLDNNSSGSA